MRSERTSEAFVAAIQNPLRLTLGILRHTVFYSRDETRASFFAVKEIFLS